MVSKTVKRNSNILWRRSGNDMLLFGLETGSLWRLNSTGARIWELLDGKYSAMDIVKILCEGFPGVSEQRVRKGLETFLAKLKARELVNT